MRPFEYVRATSVDDAVAAHVASAAAPTAAHAAATGIPTVAFLAGGTNLVDHLRLGIRDADRLIDINRLDLGGVEETSDGGVRIGANVRNADLAAHPLIRTRYPVVSQALLAGASGQIRAMASTAGNLLQRTRCVYFQDVTTPCNKREPGTGCSAIHGYGTHNAILGASDQCVAVHPSDLCVPLAALDAVVHVTGADGPRAIPFGELHRLPGDHPERDTTLEPGDLVTAVELPPLAFATRSRYRKVRERASYAFALISVAAALDVEDGLVRDVRLALGGVAHKPHRATTAEDELRGRPATTESFGAALDAELRDARAGEENAYKIPLVRSTAVAVLADLAEGARR